MIKLINVAKRYTDTLALDRINLTLKPGEFCYLIGKSGAGKSTLLKLLYGAEKPSDGHIHSGGYDLSDITHQELVAYRQQIGIIFQDFKLFPSRNVYGNVAYRLEIAGYSPSDVQKRVTQTLATVGLSAYARHEVTELSGGEQQRLAIARALITRPRLLIADEPTANLDQQNGVNIMALLEHLNKSGTTIIMATHNVGIVNTLPKRLIEIQAGNIIRDQLSGTYH